MNSGRIFIMQNCFYQKSFEVHLKECWQQQIKEQTLIWVRHQTTFTVPIWCVTGSSYRKSQRKPTRK